MKYTWPRGILRAAHQVKSTANYFIMAVPAQRTYGKHSGNFSDAAQTQKTKLQTKVGTRTEHGIHAAQLARQQHSDARQERGMAWALQVRSPAGT
jgi:hypothetical protein